MRFVFKYRLFLVISFKLNIVILSRIFLFSFVTFIVSFILLFFILLSVNYPKFMHAHHASIPFPTNLYPRAPLHGAMLPLAPPNLSAPPFHVGSLLAAPCTTTLKAMLHVISLIECKVGTPIKGREHDLKIEKKKRDTGDIKKRGGTRRIKKRVFFVLK